MTSFMEQVCGWALFFSDVYARVRPCNALAVYYIQQELTFPPPPSPSPSSLPYFARDSFSGSLTNWCRFSRRRRCQAKKTHTPFLSQARSSCSNIRRYVFGLCLHLRVSAYQQIDDDSSNVFGSNGCADRHRCFSEGISVNSHWLRWIIFANELVEWNVLNESPLAWMISLHLLIVMIHLRPYLFTEIYGMLIYRKQAGQLPVLHLRRGQTEFFKPCANVVRLSFPPICACNLQQRTRVMGDNQSC